MHPNLSFDLLKTQTEACKAYGISYSIYTCVGWNEEFATRHPEWQEVSPEGLLGAKPPFERNFYQWQKLCLNNLEYREVIKAELKEEYERFHPKGFWIDIILQNECVCHACRDRAKTLGFDVESASDRCKMARLAQIDYMRDIYAFVMSLDPALHVYFNGYPYAYDLNDQPEYANANKRECVTFMDIESLPSTEWGVFPLPDLGELRQQVPDPRRNHDERQVPSGLGRFWLAEKTLPRLSMSAFARKRTARASAWGISCTPPALWMGASTSALARCFPKWKPRNLGAAVQRRLRRLASMAPSAPRRRSPTAWISLSRGAYRALTELKYQFDIVDLTDPIDQYELLILPDRVTLTEEAASRIDAYVEKGGKLLATGHSAAGGDGFMLKCLPVKYLGEGRTAPRYIDVCEGAFEGRSRDEDGCLLGRCACFGKTGFAGCCAIRWTATSTALRRTSALIVRRRPSSRATASPASW